ncbi:hypothetical protein DFJ67_7665 [Asanoa ferruginea]|uniref:Uncharacterized protein n=1 Tax=Asanoa ferruginea TaxID=53367 RepID=A0A3D9ZX27_9ACTN|nr:hypothetical protein [Asanoa ferruginea]REG01580.1 hypothetical protein DFJ67_7665 [Asanoa ferruginea]GIF51542.1 hypothetical protein Afe04nite_60810 [Asanoa ferruginea]
MLVAREVSRWTNRYAVIRDGRRVTTLDAVLRDGQPASFTLEGRRYSIPGAIWDTRLVLHDETGGALGVAERGRDEWWSITSAGQTYHLRRTFIVAARDRLDSGDPPLGRVYRTGGAERAVELELPGAPELVQVFLLAVVIAGRDAQVTFRGTGFWQRWA